MLRTEHISRNTKKENFLALLGYEVCFPALNVLPSSSAPKHGYLDGADFQSMHINKPMVFHVGVCSCPVIHNLGFNWRMV